MLAYTVGHFNNDLCAAQWFVYLTWYINKVVGLSPRLSGLCCLSGQIADGVTTPIVGFLSDKFNSKKFGKRQPWYYIGTAIVIPTFAGIFTYPAFINQKDEFGEPVNETLRAAWYLTLPALFNIGWASVQIAHMSVVNQLSFDNERRDILINSRNGFTYAANITVLILAFLFFQFSEATAAEKFRYFSIIGMIMGFFATFFYVNQIDEVKLTEAAQHYDTQYKKDMEGLLGNPEDDDTESSEKEVKDWKVWSKQSIFWINGTIYMCVRIAVNVTMTMLPFYLDKVTKFSPTLEDPTPSELALVPLLAYVMSMYFSISL